MFTWSDIEAARLSDGGEHQRTAQAEHMIPEHLA